MSDRAAEEAYERDQAIVGIEQSLDVIDDKLERIAEALETIAAAAKKFTEARNGEKSVFETVFGRSGL